MASITSYLKSTATENKPLVIHGPSGCGKTSVMAKAAIQGKDNHPGSIFIVRFLGTTSESSNISKLLYSICCQIMRLFGQDIESIPKVRLLYLFNRDNILTNI